MESGMESGMGSGMGSKDRIQGQDPEMGSGMRSGIGSDGIQGWGSGMGSRGGIQRWDSVGSKLESRDGIQWDGIQWDAKMGSNGIRDRIQG